MQSYFEVNADALTSDMFVYIRKKFYGKKLETMLLNSSLWFKIIHLAAMSDAYQSRILFFYVIQQTVL